MRGEKEMGLSARAASLGSPPHARGKVVILIGLLFGRRITPACAGKSLLRDTHIMYLWDHPRMRGEKATPVSSALTRLGSPPHARGKEGGQNLPPDLLRITPACAGKSG